jgi:phosphoenolpyruvate carboxylase
MGSQDTDHNQPPLIDEEAFTNAAELRVSLLEKLREYREGTSVYPIQNPVQRLALDLFDRIENKELSLGNLESLVQLLTVNGLLSRAQHLQAYVGPCSREENERRLRERILALTVSKTSGPVPFDDFCKRLEKEVYGIVFTGHPTFGISRSLTHTLADLSVRDDLAAVVNDDAVIRPLTAQIVEEQQGTQEPINLSDELEFAKLATTNAQNALDRVYEIALDVAAGSYPDQWTELTPRLLTLASWVGFDIDGRKDIDWTESLRARMHSQVHQFEQYLSNLKSIAAELADDEKNLKSIQSIEKRLMDTYEQAQEDVNLLPYGAGKSEKIKEFSVHQAQSRQKRLTDPAEIIKQINTIIKAGVSKPTTYKLILLRARLANLGFGTTHVHVRINAIQLVNAIRHEVDLKTDPNDPRYRRTFLRDLNRLLDTVEPVTINYGSILDETMTAKRMFLLVTQITKYVDCSVPIRFLIAECDSIFIVLTALYFARLFNVADRIDISPLFETAEGLEHGHEIIDELLKNQHFRDYLQQRGRLCIETGYSDSGRYIGQVTASLAIERLHVKICQAMAEAGLEGVDVVMFDTHGESMGRGAHPVSFEDRLNYTVSPVSRSLFKQSGVGLIRETSFQGGDGFVYFANPDIAFATVSRILEYALVEPEIPKEDLFYKDTDYSLEFFMTLKSFHERLVDNPDYNALLNVFGTNLLYPTGSRMVKREGSSRDKPIHAHPSHIRAIPNNAILQQMGFLANSCGGLGRAIMRNQERFNEVYARSDRCRLLMSLAAHARVNSSLSSLGAYARLFDPIAWLLRASKWPDKDRAVHMRALAGLLAQDNTYERMNRVFHILLRDAISFDVGIADLEDQSLPQVSNDDERADLTLLHAVRIAILNELFLLIVRIPQFRSEPDITIEEVLGQLLKLDVPDGVSVLKRAFPTSSGSRNNVDSFGEDATYRVDDGHGYAREEQELFKPMLELHDQVRRISVAIFQIIGAVG